MTEEEKMIADEVSKRWGHSLPARVRSAMIYSGFKSLEQLKTAFETKHDETVIDFLRMPGTGRTTINQMMSALEVKQPETEVPNLSRIYVASRGEELTKRERQLIRKLIAGHLGVDRASKVGKELITLRDKL